MVVYDLLSRFGEFERFAEDAYHCAQEPEIPEFARGYNKLEDDSFELMNYNILTMGAGGYFSTVEDLFKWEQSLYTDKLVSKESLNEIFTPQYPINEEEYYGFGWRISKFKGMNRTIYITWQLSGSNKLPNEFLFNLSREAKQSLENN